MIAHDQFGVLRLADFCPDAEIVDLSNWEFMDHMWVGEAIGFSEWLRLEDEPEVLQSLSIDFANFPVQAAAKVLQSIDLLVHAGMQFDELQKLLGDPAKEYRFVKDRVTYEFAIPGPPKFNVRCTVHNERGLTYLVVTIPFPKRPG